MSSDDETELHATYLRGLARRGSRWSHESTTGSGMASSNRETLVGGTIGRGPGI
jgi:hypothetical protein